MVRQNSHVPKFWEWHKWIFAKSAVSVFMMAIRIYSTTLWRVIRWTEINVKAPLCQEKVLNPQKTFQPRPKRTSWSHASDSLVNTAESADEAGDHSVRQIESLERSVVLEIIVLPLLTMVTYKEMHRGYLLLVRRHLNKSYIGSSRTSRREHQNFWRSFREPKKSPASTRTFS